MTGLRARRRQVRPAAVAGMFYEADSQALQSGVDELLDRAGGRSPTPMAGVVVPHAGHIYSGPVAASAYRLLPREVRRVLLIGPSHFVPLRGMAVSGADEWQTPLGRVPLDTKEAARLSDRVGALSVDDAPHAREHCLEVQVPFLQRVLQPGWQLVPIVVGHVGAEAVADLLAEALGQDDGTLLVVSTDLSHYLPYDVAAARDARTAAAVAAAEPDSITDEDACGAYALRGALTYAAACGLPVRQLDLRSSGDTAGPHDRVVGYGAFTIGAQDGDVDAERAAQRQDRQRRLLQLARRTIEEALRTGRQSTPSPMALDEDLRGPGAAFVTLRSAATGELRGCVGSLEAQRPLGVDVAAHALDAAFHDTRFMPLAEPEVSELAIDISVLGPLQELPATGYEDLVARLPVGLGLYVTAGGYRATYLPSVWSELRAPEVFVASLWRKAGMTPGAWPRGIAVYTYDVEEFGEGGS